MDRSYLSDPAVVAASRSFVCVRLLTYENAREAELLRGIFRGRSGELEIEFIEWQGGHSPHREFIEAGREGMHHLRYRVDDTDAWIEKLAPLGYAPIWYKQFSEDTIFAYLEREGDPLLIEFLRESKFGKDKFQEFLQTMGKVSRGKVDKIDAAFEAVYGVGLDGIEEEWIRYCKKR